MLRSSALFRSNIRSNIHIHQPRVILRAFSAMPSSYTRDFPSSSPVVRLDFDGSSQLYVLHFLGAETPDNRLSHKFILDGLLPALEHVENEWDALVDSGDAATGAALITTGATDEKAKIYSNGLDFENAIADPTFFDRCLNPLYEKLLTFPIPTVASLGGHAFAAGFGLACAHDYRVMNAKRGYLCMNEIDFGAQLPHGLQQALASKIVHPQTMRKIVLEGHRFSAAEALEAGIVDAVSQDGGAAGTLELAKKLADKVKIKASKDVWGSNKQVIYAPQIAIMRTKHETAMSNLDRAPAAAAAAAPSAKL